MAEGIDKGGLNYEINVVGDFEAKFARFESLLKKIETQTKIAGRDTTATGKTTPSTSANAEVKAQRGITVALNKQSIVEKKILQLKNKQVIASSKQVTAEKVITEKVVQRQKAEVSTLIVQQKATKESIAQSKAENRIANTSLKRLEIEKAIQAARAKGAVTPTQISEKTGLSVAQLEKADTQIAAQNTALKKQESLRKRNLRIQERQHVEAEKNKRAHRDIAKFAREQHISLQRAARELGVSARKAKLLGIEINKVSNFAENFLFTFRRLVGILAIFTLARRFAALIGDSIREMVRFNSVLEQSKIGFASLIASAGDMVDVHGKLVEGGDEYVASLKVSERILTKLRKSALGTVATFEDLIGAFQAAIGPGLSEGLNLDQIEAVTVAMVKAASVLGVQGSQFTEEVRSIIQGTGTVRHTRLLQIPGLSKQSIKEAKEQGRLYEQITEALAPFNEATKDVVKSWAGLTSQVRDAVSTLLASGSVEYFDTLKTSMESFINTLIDRDKIMSDNFGLNTEAVAAVEEISSALKDIIDDFRALTSVDELFTAMRLNFALLGEALKLVSDLVSPIVVGIGRGVTAMNALVAGAFKLLKVVGRNIPSPIKFLVGAFKQILSFVTSIITFFLTWVVLTKIYNGILKVTELLFKSISVLNTLITAIYVIWVEMIAGVNAGLSVTKALMAAIAATVSVINIVIGAIVILIGYALYKTGALSKVFDGLNRILGVTKDKLEGVEDDITSVTTAILGQSKASQELSESFQGIEDSITKLQNKVKSALLTAGIRGEARQVFTTFSEGYKKANDAIIKVEKELAKTRNVLAIMDKKRDEGKIRSVLEVADAITEARKKARKESTKVSLYGIPMGSSFFKSIDKLTEEQQKIVENESTYQGLLKKEKKLLEKIAESNEKYVRQIAEQVRLARIQLEQQKDGTQDINDLFALRKAIVAEELRKAKEIVRTYNLQKLKLEEQEALLQKHIELRKESIKQIEKLIVKATKIGATTETIKDLEELRTRTLAKNNVLTAKEKTLIRTMKKDLEDMAKIVVTNDWLVAMSAGFKKGAEDFIASADTLAQGFADAMQSALEDAVSSASDAITDLFDPRTEASSAKEVAGEVLLGIASSMINNILDTFLQNLIASFLGQETVAQMQISAMQANTLALEALRLTLEADQLKRAEDSFVGPPSPFSESPTSPVGEAAPSPQMVENTAALAANTIATTTDASATTVNTTATVADATATTADATATTVNATATTANTGGLISNTLSIIGETAATIAGTALLAAKFIAQTVATVALTIATWADVFTPGQKGGLVTPRGFARGFNEGGMAKLYNSVPRYTYPQGFAKGGDVTKFHRPSYISPVDTVAAWLQPGEFIIQKQRVSQFGPRFFDRINRGTITPEMGQRHLMSKIQRSRGVYGLAEGGMVGNTPTSVNRGRAMAGDVGQSNNVVLPILVADENTMDQIIAGGRDTFESSVMETPDYSNQNESNA